jgi:hypothetical protein
MGLSKKDQQALDELNAYIASRDEKTNTQSDKKILAAQVRNAKTAKTTTWKENQKVGVQQAWNEPGEKERRTRFWQDPAFKEKISVIRKEVGNREDIKKVKSERSLALHKDPEFRKKYEQGIANRVWGTDAQIEGAKRAGKQRRRAIKTPKGIFITIANVAKAYDMSVAGIQHRMKKYPGEYYYLTSEEYTKLTGKEL